MRGVPARTCRNCGELAAAHCEACNCCPEQEHPDWCELDEMVAERS